MTSSRAPQAGDHVPAEVEALSIQFPALVVWLRHVG
jgi:hypothetical protein